MKQALMSITLLVISLSVVFACLNRKEPDPIQIQY